LLAKQMQPGRHFCVRFWHGTLFGMLPASLDSERRCTRWAWRRGGAPAQLGRQLSAVLGWSLTRRGRK
jgi:hypothetical protein